MNYGGGEGGGGMATFNDHGKGICDLSLGHWPGQILAFYAQSWNGIGGVNLRLFFK
jgi:hypothetical protein